MEIHRIMMWDDVADVMQSEAGCKISDLDPELEAVAAEVLSPDNEVEGVILYIPGTTWELLKKAGHC